MRPELAEEIKEWLSAWDSRSRIFIIGRLEDVGEIVTLLRSCDLEPAGILDNDSVKWGRCFMGLTISSPKKALLPNDENIRIIVHSPKYWAEILRQFEGFGYGEGEQVFVLERPSPESNWRAVRAGLALYKKLRREYGQRKIFLADGPLGDYYLLGLYFHTYCQSNGISSYLMAGASKGLKKLSPYFGIEPVVSLTQEQSNSLIQAWTFFGEDVLELFPLTRWQGKFRFNPSLLRLSHHCTFMDTFRCFAYGLPSDTQPCHPQWQGDREAVERYLQSRGAKPGLGVLLAPFAYSAQIMPWAFWQKLASVLQEKGYQVFINVAGAEEQSDIEGASVLRFDFPDTIQAMEYLGLVIGTRSGFFDVTCQANCHRIVFYPSKTPGLVPWHHPDIEFCGLERMELCAGDEKLKEITVDKEQSLAQLLKDIEGYL
ncbi:MAG: hypothetical protein E7203_08560 [Selenomonas ruminantium]|jgi:hypothetical protein|uniref:ADP-heptose:LPS heptosyltransferase n=1 Tax=Selenomonas ruminantium TaxID=971 RepID=A0A927ZZD5_SELRU|nr:hypothetical protein [Selenomonas ruminantium]MBE6085483.1 hypothetical protein [Selenomonas ruminantium]